MFIPIFDTNPSQKDIDKFMDSYWVRQINNYRNNWKQIKDSNYFIKERTGAYPLWHIEFRNHNLKPQVVLSDSAPVPLSDKPISDKTVVRVSPSENSSFKEMIKSLPKRTHGFKRSIDIIRGEIDIDGRVNNPNTYAGNKNIQQRRGK